MLVLLSLLLIASAACAEFPTPQIEFQPREYVCYRAEGLHIDGKLDDVAWESAAWTEGFVDIEGHLKPLPTFTTRVKMLWDDNYFYFAAEMEEPHIWAKLTVRDAVIYHDNDFEIFLDPDGDTHNYYELEVNAMGTEWDLFLDKPYRDGDDVAHNEWDIDGLITAIDIDGTLNNPDDIDKGWTIEIAIPWGCMQEPRPIVGEQWRVNFSRVEWDVDEQYNKLGNPEHNWVWSPQGLIAMHYPEMWGFVQFADAETEFVFNSDELEKWELRKQYYNYKNGEELPSWMSKDGRPWIAPSASVQAFYYPWYDNPDFGDSYFHWSHRVMGDVEVPHTYLGGDDIGADFYPELGCYSSHDPAVVEKHMEQLVTAGVGTISVSWWGADTFEGKAVPLIMDKAEKFGLKVNFHIEPFPGRNAETTFEQLKFIIDNYGDHPAFYRFNNKPLFYVYDSYFIPAEEWASILQPGDKSIRGTKYDSVMIGLWVQEKEEQFFLDSGFDGFYNYFAVDGFTFGSTWKNWEQMENWAAENGKIFIPCVGPGYIDTKIRPWNAVNIRDRENGKYYDSAFGNALKIKPEIIGITSFNEWHEGTQIEPSIAKEGYEDFEPMNPDAYLHRTRAWVERFKKADK